MDGPLGRRIERRMATLNSEEDQICASIRDDINSSPTKRDGFLDLVKVLADDNLGGIRKLPGRALEVVSFMALVTARRILADSDVLK
jgi:hypothetical protein